jgi:predicted ABC-type ATPase
MDLPILQALKDGEKFDFATLADNIEQADEFWDWWWATKSETGVLTRPEIIADGDPILTHTDCKAVVDFARHAELFDRPLWETITSGRLPSRDGWPREQFRERLIRLVFGSSTKLAAAPHIVFAGGGYGSGKTTTLNHLACQGKLPVKLRDLVGVDVFKLLIPEFHLIKNVADGRASLTVQRECQELAADLFDMLLESRRSFIWDSSMSNKAETTARIALARDNGYTLTMIAVLTPLEIAIQQAMNRAQQSRRFPHPNALPNSHSGFREAFHDYVPLFDAVTVFAKEAAGSDNCYVVGEKMIGTNDLAIFDEPLLSRALSS